LFVGNEST